MAIKFICACGKHLRARDEMAARRSACPACGAPVGIPSLQPTQRGTTPRPLLPSEKLARRRIVPAAVLANPTDLLTADVPGSTQPAQPELDADKKATTRRKRDYRELEMCWHHCLHFPLPLVGCVLALAALSTALSLVMLAAIPRALLDLQAQPWEVWFLCSLGLLVPLVGLGYASCLLDEMLASALTGDVCNIPWPGVNLSADLGRVCNSLLAWALCLLAGPIVLIAAFVAFWIRCGDVTWLDWVILSELAVVGTGYWLVSRLAVCRSNRLYDANPIRAVQLIHQLSYRALLAAVLGFVLIASFGSLLLLGASTLHSSVPAGISLLALGWFSGLFGAASLFRLLGMWCRQTHVVAETSAA